MDIPQTEIASEFVKAKVLVPDPVRGYYQGTRFDWSGVISSLQYQGHEYFGQWFEKYDPKIHDALMGPVEEYLTNDAGIGYDEAKPGEAFLRIGVGVLRKPDEKAYHRFETYEIIDHGKWQIKQGRDWIEFSHKVKGPFGYAYLYTKRMELAKDKPALLLFHSLENTGQRVIETAQYNHNFFMFDNQPTGPGAVVKFGFDAHALDDLKGVAALRDKQLEYSRELEKGEAVSTSVGGFGTSSSDYNLRMEHAKAGIGVHITGDQPISKVFYWSIRTTLCPELYIQLRAEPGKTVRWKFAYYFYTLPAAASQ